MMTTLDARLAADALADALEDYTRGGDFARAFRHADGSITVIGYDQYPANPRDEYDQTATLVGTRPDGWPHWSPLDSDTAGMVDAFDRFRDYPDTLGMVRRYVAMFRPDIAAVDTWEVSGSSQSDWRAGIGYVTRDALAAAGYSEDGRETLSGTLRMRAAAILAGEVAEYGAYFAGEVYTATHLEVGAPVVAFGPDGAYVDGYTVDSDGPVCGFIGYDTLEDIAGTFTDSPVTEVIWS